MGWALMVTGGLVMVTPGILDPFTPVNGLTLIGFVLVVAGTMSLMGRRV